MRLASNRLRATLSLLLLALTAMAGPQLHDLYVSVVLSANGDARITETRHMSIDSEGTECYIVQGHLNGSRISDLEVSDETGAVYENVGAWNVSQSRTWKTRRCGIVSKSDGYELCWGLGESGERTYTTSYTVTQLLRGYSDADGFNFMFVGQDMSPSPEHVRLTVMAADSVSLSPENTKVWAFRYRGSAYVMGNCIVAESDEAFSRGSALVLMAQFDKGLFAPRKVSESSFEEVKQRAFDGSDYDDEDDTEWPLILLAALFYLAPLFAFAWRLVRIWRERRRVNKDLTYCRELPGKTDLLWAGRTLNALRYVNANYDNMLSAALLQLVNHGALEIVRQQDAKGKTSQAYAVRELRDADRSSTLLHKLYNVLKQAAGSDGILQPDELTTWLKRNSKHIEDFVNMLHSQTTLKQCQQQRDKVRQLYGLRKYLKDFSLVGERHLEEVSLWNDYLVYATLFGMADQVVKDMRKLNPEYTQLNQFYQAVADRSTLPVLVRSLNTGTHKADSAIAERKARAAGGGGTASWGGGGGFSGGGSGGGVR